MSWLSNSLQLAGELLESVDQKASATLKPRGGDERKKPKQDEATVAWETKPASGGEYEDEVQSHSSTDFDPPSRPTSQTNLATTVGQQPDPRDADTFSEWSEVDNESNSGIIMEEMPLSTSSSRSSKSQLPPLPADMQTMKNEALRLRRENSKLRNDVSSVERQLHNRQEQLDVCQEELEALDKECMDKITSLERDIASLKAEKATDEAQFVQALAAKDTFVQTLQADATHAKEALVQKENEVDALKRTLSDLTSTKEQAWANAASGEAHLQQRLTSLQSELKDAAAQVAQLKKEHHETKQSMYLRQCALEATNAELTSYVAKLEQNGAKTPNPAHESVHKTLQQVQETLASTKKMLHEECRKALLQAQEIAKLNQDMAAMHALVVQKEQAHATVVLEWQQKLLAQQKDARPAVVVAPPSLATSTAAASTDGQMHAMTRRLLEKQEQLDALRSRYATLEVRFNDLKAAKDAQLDKNDDLEINVRPRYFGGGMRSRQAYHKIPAFEAADRMMLTVGRFLRAYPEARLALLGYLALLHLWAFVILGFHTSHLSEEMQVKAKTP
ncbi:Aste57867_14070 [Aphanomyces stellatus]|uniref:Aste57867_14070 protein n=1 Tax=Aphanomyces stellatus TaxID=120398 RepID=A0A485L0A3_9STRA|nr:hypothetical protein As57867_014019 [Aphanomyces stellatus]VFT90898.1 Aste57867_14070 [Aphanomyces stellatus]